MENTSTEGGGAVNDAKVLNKKRKVQSDKKLSADTKALLDTKHSDEKKKPFKLVPIYPTGYVQWDIYNIVIRSFCPYRNITVSDDMIPKEQFIKDMKYNGYIKINGIDESRQLYAISILSQNEKSTNEIASVTEKFRLFNSTHTSDLKIIIITPKEFQSHVLRYIVNNKIKNIYIYHYDEFKIVKPLGPRCGVHTILTPAEQEEYLNHFQISMNNMKKVYLNDPQIIWLGAEGDQIVKTVRQTSATGYSDEYRRVIKVLLTGKGVNR